MHVVADVPAFFAPDCTVQGRARFSCFLYQAHAGRTTLLVAQKLATIRCADKIVVMRSGRMVDYGTHNELVKKASGAYLELLSTQVHVLRALTCTTFVCGEPLAAGHSVRVL